MLQQRAVKEWMGGDWKNSVWKVSRGFSFEPIGQGIGWSISCGQPEDGSETQRPLTTKQNVATDVRTFFSVAKRSIPKGLHDDGSGNAQHARRKMLCRRSTPCAKSKRTLHEPVSEYLGDGSGASTILGCGFIGGGCG